MPTGQAKSPWYVTVILIAIVVSLVVGGIRLIYESETQYDKSISYTDRILGDSALKNKTSMLPGYTLTKEGYTTALLYFTLAIGVILLSVLLPRLQSINVGTGGVSLNLRDVPEKLDDIIKQNNAIQASSAGEGGYKQKSMDIAPEKIKRNFAYTATANYNDDPQKGRWGGEPVSNNRQLSATVAPSVVPGFYKVTLTVASSNLAFPLKGLVKFHLHNTFLNPDPIISAENNRAVLRLTRVYGAFTVGAETDNGATRLELDLSLDNTFPDDFRNK